ncbi:type VI secretion system tube protein TssD [Flavobacterium sp.]|uniref:type VI secretion system tube protein TssD n=1 Tax=Flavobacterium sp. TaxID=239 RepID=UPI00286D5A4C|nr:type VI secretion system tube protein TssD [Flavobacterium sp.]
MASKAVLEIEGKKYNVLEFNYKLHQEAGRNGFPCGNVSGGHIIMVIESDKNIEAFDWAKSADVQKEGTVSFYNHDGMSIFKKLEFREAYCFLYKEEFDSNGKFAMRHTIEISPGNANYQGINFTKDWSKPQIDIKNASTFEEKEEEEKKVTVLFDANNSDVKNGKFGFDKFDSDFKKNYTGKDFTKFENEYNPIQVNGDKYLPVWVSMRKGQTITLNVENIKRKNYKLYNDIKFEANPDFTFEPANLKDVSEIQITCNNSGSQTQIKLEGDGEVVGAINFFYPEVKTVNLDWRFVEITGKREDENIINSKIDLAKLKELLKKAFNPMLIDFNIENINPKITDLTKENLTGVFDKVGKIEYIPISRKRSFVAFTEKVSPPSATSLTLYLVNRHCMDKANASIEDGSKSFVGGFSETNSGIAYGILVDEEPAKIIPEAVAHEIMHALGLEHTFAEQNSHIFKGKSTDNYMDYSTRKIYTWKWQWEIARNNKLLK